MNSALSGMDALETIPLDDILASDDDVDGLTLLDADFFEPTVSMIQPAEEIRSAQTNVNKKLAMSKSPALIDCTFQTKTKDTRKRQREETEYLRSKVEVLEQNLKVRQQIKSQDKDNETPWQNIATRIRNARAGTTHKFRKTLQALMKKKPKLTTLPTLASDQWRLNKLVKDPSLRRQAMHDICEQQYQLTEFMLVENGLLDRVDEYVSCSPRLSKINNELVIQFASCTTRAFDFNAMSDLVWSLFQGLRAGANKRNVEFGRLLQQVQLFYKRYIENNRHVIVGRSILEDELYPFQNGDLVLNKSSWIVLEKVDNGAACRLKYMQKSTLPMIQLNNAAKRDILSQHNRIGSVTDSVLLSLKTMNLEFTRAIDTMLKAHSTNAVDTLVY
ncbi:hypothetical protein AeRB84_019138 [Aphanomyces euteiches]|nr:hypothetical protein AeRB84_019138 [Aphanomyces euteiches]